MCKVCTLGFFVATGRIHTAREKVVYSKSTRYMHHENDSDYSDSEGRLDNGSKKAQAPEGSAALASAASSSASTCTSSVEESQNMEEETGGNRPRSPAQTEGGRSTSASVMSHDVGNEMRVGATFSKDSENTLRSLVFHHTDGTQTLINEERLESIGLDADGDRDVAKKLWAVLVNALRPQADKRLQHSLPTWGQTLLNSVELAFDYEVCIGTGAARKQPKRGEVVDLNIFSQSAGGFPHAIDFTGGLSHWSVYSTKMISIRARLRSGNGINDYCEKRLLRDMEKSFLDCFGFRPIKELMRHIRYKLLLVYADPDYQTGAHVQFDASDLKNSQGLKPDRTNGRRHVFLPANPSYYHLTMCEGRLGGHGGFAFKINPAICSSLLKQKDRKFCLRLQCEHPVLSNFPKMHAMSVPFVLSAKKRSSTEMRLAADAEGRKKVGEKRGRPSVKESISQVGQVGQVG